MALTTGFQLPFGIQPLNPVPTDAWSGPYEGVTLNAALSAANNSIPSAARFKSLEVRLIVDGTARKFWYRNGILDSDLIEFTDDTKLPLSGGTLVGSLTGTTATFTTSVSAPAISGVFFGDGSYLTGVSGGGSTYTPPADATFTSSVSAPSLSGKFYGDGSSLTGVLTSLPIASVTTLGAVKVDGVSIEVDPQGVLSLPVSKYYTTIGNGTDKDFTVTHSLSSEEIGISIYDTSTKAMVFTYVQILDINSIKVSFSNPPTTNGYKVVVVA